MNDPYNTSEDPNYGLADTSAISGSSDSSGWLSGLGDFFQTLAPTIVNSAKAFQTPGTQLVYNPATGTNQVARTGTYIPGTSPLNVNQGTLVYLGIGIIALVLILRK